jgi:hypothetical protein
VRTVELIRLRLLSCSYTFDELVTWMRRKRPRVMRDAIGVLLLRLKHQGRVRIINGRWETCRPIMLSLGPKIPSNVIPFRKRQKPFRYSSQPPFDIEEETA